ncbi:tripartite tricarboxylate transporter substrate binding protein [Ensifer sp. YR511]|uniref:Bug family tripartite tricarboxylate transporter substrate binding protein n=1 Tax=Ensifer sp. YR511 TaxID=1855294 RepID=UPI00088D968E|nr:tripartite tricarboxylate transporter substrate-binding protein [Ensifer sp. YR511]SDN41418.1 Tripartite-type tricarboxylate transporter, receptor component TctC [Ensifer sp. YR511]
MTTIWRRTCTALALLTSLAMGTAAQAEDFPSRPVTIIVPYAPGGQGDITGRLIAEHLSGLIGQPVTVENQSGANGVIGISAIAEAEPDGYTIGVVVASHAMARALVPNLPYDPVKSFTPITTTARTDIVLVANPKLGVHDLKGFIAYAKTHPGDVAFDSSGPGSNSHVFGEWLAEAAGLDLIHVPYKGAGDALPDLLSGVLQFGFKSVPAVRGYLDNKQLIAIASGGPERTPIYPDLPTAAEQGLPGFAANSWGMVMAPADVPADRVAYLNAKIVEVLKRPDVVEKFQSMGANVIANTPDEARTMLEGEEKTYSDLISRLGISLNK